MSGNTNRNGTAFAVWHFAKAQKLNCNPSRRSRWPVIFLELVAALARLKPSVFALDGEIAVPAGRDFSFDALLQRIHPAASRVQRLATEIPSIYVVFDLLAAEDGRSLLTQPLRKRRSRLEEFAASFWTAFGCRQPRSRLRKRKNGWQKRVRLSTASWPNDVT